MFKLTAVILLYLSMGFGNARATNLKYSTTLSIWDAKDFKGTRDKHINLDQVDYYKPADNGFQKELKSLKIETGTCVEYHVKAPSAAVSDTKKLKASWNFVSGKQYNTSGSSLNKANIDGLKEGKIAFLKSCGVQTIKKSCPDSMYVMELAWNKFSMEKDGIEIGCQKPSSDKIDERLRSHGSTKATYKQRSNCKGFGGFHVSRSVKSETVMSIDPYCFSKELPKLKNSRKGDEWTITEDCSLGQMIIGIEVDLEYNTNYIKGVYPICRAPNIGRDCQPSDQLHQLKACTNRNDSVGEITCNQKMEVGTSVTKTMSKGTSLEYAFYGDLGYEKSLAGKAMQKGFSRKLKTSATTGYKWDFATEDTYRSSYTHEIKASAPIGFRTSLLEVVGICGFLQVKPNYIKLTDEPCKNAKCRE